MAFKVDPGSIAVLRDLGVLCLHTCSETSSLTADPKLHVKTAFRCARQGIHDAVAGGTYAVFFPAVYGERSFAAPEEQAERWVFVARNRAIGQKNEGERSR